MLIRQIIFLLLIAAGFFYVWKTNLSLRQDFYSEDRTLYDADYYIEEFTVLTMGEDGLPLSRLKAKSMKHNLDDGTSELEQPILAVFREDDAPLFIKAEKGWVIHNENTVQMEGGVNLWENNSLGDSVFDVLTSEVKVLFNDEYAESKQHITIKVDNTTVTAKWIRAYFKDSRIEILDHEKTTVTDIDSI